MKKRDWLIVILPLVLTFLVDRLTKIWATDLVGYNDFGVVGFTLHHNYGAMLGLFSQLPPVLRIVSLSTGGAFLTFTYFIIQYLLPIRSIALRVGLSMLLGGILGNVFDRIVWGYVVDFLVFRWDQLHTPVMNLADVLQWVGYFLIVYALIKEGKILWPEENNRKSYWVNPKYQLRYCFSLSAFGAALSLIAGVFSFTYFKVTLQSFSYISVANQNKYLYPYVITFIIISLAFCSLLFFVGLILSNRAAGPVYAFEKFLEDISQGKFRGFKLRAGDEFTHLEEIAETLSKRLKEKYKLDTSDLSEEQVNEQLEFMGPFQENHNPNTATLSDDPHSEEEEEEEEDTSPKS
ncbi:MAG: signal peptidase II [Bdellovibrionales bacterium]